MISINLSPEQVASVLAQAAGGLAPQPTPTPQPTTEPAPTPQPEAGGGLEVPFGGAARTYATVDGDNPLVLSFVTPAGPTMIHGAANISISEYNSPPSHMRAVLAESPNATDGPYGWVSEGNSNTLTLDIGGNPNGMGTAELKANTRYFVTITRAGGGGIQAFIAKPGYL